MSVLEPGLTSNAGLRISIFSNPSYSCVCNFVSEDKFQFALSHKTKFHIQKCYTSRDIEIQSRRIRFYNGTVHAYQYSAVLNLVQLDLPVLNLVPVHVIWICPLEREKPCSYEFLIQNNFFIKKIISSNFSARGAPRAAVNHLTMQHGSPAWSSTPMVWLHLVTPLPIRVSGFSTCRLRLTLFLFWDLSNRIGPGNRSRNFLGRFYGGRNEISRMISRSDVFRLAWVDLPRIRARFSTCLDTRIGSGSQSAFSLKER